MNFSIRGLAVGYYLRDALSYRDMSEILRERGVNVHHSIVCRWVQEYAPILYQIWNKKLYYKWCIDADCHTLDIRWLRKKRGSVAKSEKI